MLNQTALTTETTYESYYRSIFDAYYASMVNVAYRYVHIQSDSEDLVQNVFVSIWNAKTYYADTVQMRNYLFRSTLNAAYNYLRHKHIEVAALSRLKDVQPDDDRLQQALDEHDLWCRVIAAVEKLPGRCREICRMTLDGKKPSQIAAELNLSVETVKTQKRIGVQKLKESLGCLVFLFFPLC